MSEWKECKLGEIVIFQRGYDITQKEQIPGIFPVVSSSGVKSYHNQFKVNGPGVVIGRKGTLGTVYYLGKEFWPHDTTLWVKDFKGNYPNFVYYFLKTFGFENYDVGSSNPTLNRNHIHQLCALLPPIPEQKHIAFVLRSLDDKIDLLHRQNDTLEAMAETFFRQWFMEEAKEDWEEATLSKIIDVVIDNRGKTPPTVDYKTEYPLIEVNALNSNSCLIDYSVIKKYVSKEIFGSWFRKHLNLNDVIISTVGTIGVFSIHLSAKGCIAQNLVGLRSKSISGYFIYNFLKVNKEKILNLDIGGVQPSIKVPHLLDLKIKLPSVCLINKYHTTVDEYYKKIAINSNQIRTLTALRDTLLPKLMSGEVRVEM